MEKNEFQVTTILDDGSEFIFAFEKTQVNQFGQKVDMEKEFNRKLHGLTDKTKQWEKE